MIPAKVKNWSTFQHYNRRAPTWIKLHRKLLDDFAFVRLPTVAKAVLPLVWLLAAEGDSDGAFDAEPDYLAFRFRMPLLEVAEATVQLVNQGFISLSAGHASELLARCARIIREGAPPALVVASAPSIPSPESSAPVQLENQRVTDGGPDDASKLLATGYNPARPETETETETELKKEQTPSVGNATGPAPQISNDPPDAGNAGAEPAAASLVVIRLPEKGGEQIPFTRETLLELAECYPLVDVDAELRAILGWLRTNPGRLKVGLKGTRRMVGTWLGKAQREAADKARANPGRAPSAVGRTFDDDEHAAAGSGFWLDPPPSTPED